MHSSSGPHSGKRAARGGASRSAARHGPPDVTRRYLDLASRTAALYGPGDPAARRVAARQHRVISSAQAGLCELSRKAVSGRCIRGEWRELYPGAYLIGIEAPSYPAQTLAAVFSRAPAVVAGGASAGWLSGMLEREPATVQLTVLDGRNPGALEGVRIHRPRTLVPHQIRWRQGIPVTSPADTLLELASVLPHDELEAACALALRKRLISRAELERRIDQSPRRPGIPTLRAVARAPRVTRSHNERRMLELIRLAELPIPEANVVIEGKEVDLYWSDARLVVEVDAFGTHGEARSFEDDRKLDGDFAAADLEIRRFTGRRIRDQPYAVVARLAAVLARRLGGLPPPRRR